MNKIHYADRVKKWYQLRDSIEEESQKQQKSLAIFDLPNNDLEIREFTGDSKNMILICKYPRPF